MGGEGDIDRPAVNWRITGATSISNDEASASTLATRAANFAMLISVTRDTKCYQISFGVLPPTASECLMMNFEMLHTSAALAAVTVTLQHSPA
jgi:hypothetical protein